MKKTREYRKTIAVIGGGASGLIAAIAAADEVKRQKSAADIVIYEANARVGKKLLVTGNGRCNFSNKSVTADNFYGEPKLALSIYEKFDNSQTVEFFRSIGVLAKADVSGRIYPMSFQASAVLDALRYEVQRLGITIQTDTPVDTIEPLQYGYLLNGSYRADVCIIATGGKAAPVHGSNGSGFRLLESLGIKATPLYPALVPLVCDRFNKGLKGVRAQGTISIRCNGRELACDTGEIQYTEYGLSGIPSMQVSASVAAALDVANSDVIAVVDSCPELGSRELKSALTEFAVMNPDMPAEMLLAGIIPKKLGSQLIADCSLNPLKPIGRIHEGVIDKIVTTVKSKKYRVVAVKSFADAQVTAGGISAGEINENSLELKTLKNVFVCGELVNVHGDCGGYNLQWAWSSGFIAGKNAAKELLKCSE